jgi:hypothetical protein
MFFPSDLLEKKDHIETFFPAFATAAGRGDSPAIRPQSYQTPISPPFHGEFATHCSVALKERKGHGQKGQHIQSRSGERHAAATGW